MGAHSPRLPDAGPAERPRRHADDLVHAASRLRAAHDRALAEISVSHRRGARGAPHADRARAAAVHRIRLQPAGAVGREGGRHVAVHAGHGPHVQPEAQHVAGRAPRRAGVDERRARLPVAPARHVRRLVSGAGRIQLGRGQRAARDRAQPGGRPADRLPEPADAERDAQLRAEAAGGEETSSPIRSNSVSRCRTFRTTRTS